MSGTRLQNDRRLSLLDKVTSEKVLIFAIGRVALFILWPPLTFLFFVLSGMSLINLMPKCVDVLYYEMRAHEKIIKASASVKVKILQN